jgi:hypothetical protein
MKKFKVIKQHLKKKIKCFECDTIKNVIILMQNFFEYMFANTTIVIT